MTCLWAPACEVALDEATSLWPHRRTSSDGVCASAKHTAQNPGSDHEPRIIINGRGYASAFDLSDDKSNGCDADFLVEHLRINRDKRIKYVIAEYMMYSSYAGHKNGEPFSAWTWRPYTGSNPHSSHVHVSVKKEYLFDTSPWWGPIIAAQNPTHVPVKDDDDMPWTDEDSKNLKRAADALEAINHQVSATFDQGSRLARITRHITEIRNQIVKP